MSLSDYRYYDLVFDALPKLYELQKIIRLYNEWEIDKSIDISELIELLERIDRIKLNAGRKTLEAQGFFYIKNIFQKEQYLNKKKEYLEAIDAVNGILTQKTSGRLEIESRKAHQIREERNQIDVLQENVIPKKIGYRDYFDDFNLFSDNNKIYYLNIPSDNIEVQNPVNIEMMSDSTEAQEINNPYYAIPKGAKIEPMPALPTNKLAELLQPGKFRKRGLNTPRYDDFSAMYAALSNTPAAVQEKLSKKLDRSSFIVPQRAIDLGGVQTKAQLANLGGFLNYNTINNQLPSRVNYRPEYVAGQVQENEKKEANYASIRAAIAANPKLGVISKWFESLRPIEGVDNNFVFDGRYYYIYGLDRPINKQQIKDLSLALKSLIIKQAHTPEGYKNTEMLKFHIKQARALYGINQASANFVAALKGYGKAIITLGDWDKKGDKALKKTIKAQFKMADSLLGETVKSIPPSDYTPYQKNIRYVVGSGVEATEGISKANLGLQIKTYEKNASEAKFINKWGVSKQNKKASLKQLEENIKDARKMTISAAIGNKPGTWLEVETNSRNPAAFDFGAYTPYYSENALKNVGSSRAKFIGDELMMYTQSYSDLKNRGAATDLYRTWA